MKIKKAMIGDLEIAAGLFDLYRQFYDQKPDLNSARNFLSERISKNESEIFLSIDEENNNGMGFVQLYPSFSSGSMKKLWILNDLYVHEKYRKLGVAEALINRSKQLALETRANTLILETHTSNVIAQKLYDRTGFEKVNGSYFYFLKI